MKFVQKVVIFLIYFILFLQLLINYFSLDTEIMKKNYLFLLLSYIICGAIFLVTIFKKKYYIFEPYTLVSLLYIAIMIYRPCLDIANGIYYRFNVFVMNGCIKATAIFTICFIIFSFAYNFRFVSNSKRNTNKSLEKERTGTTLLDYSKFYTKNVRRICILLFILGLFSALIYYKTAGYNPLAFLTNLNQGENTYLFDSNFKFLAKVAYLMIIPWLFISKFDKSKLLRIITSFFMFTIFLIGGSRYIIVISLLAYIILPYISERKSFSFKKGFLIFIILLIFCDIIAYTRVGTRTGNSIDFASIKTFVKITDVFDSDLTIYQPFYCIAEKVPSVLPYQMGKGLIGYSIVSFLPRFLFPWKSEFDIMAKSIETVMNKTAKMAGLAMPNIGEFYLEFGIIGCIICMYIFGIICKNLKKLYINEKSGINELILYSVLFPFLMQIVCRGYLSVQLNSLLFIVLPYFFIRYELKKQKQVVR